MDKKTLINMLNGYMPSDTNEQFYKLQMIDFLNNNEIFLGKKNNAGHFTASSWILNSDRTKVLLTLHNKLNKWCQLGGHTEEDEDIFSCAQREAQEESGLLSIKPISNEIFDIDVHKIPAYGTNPEHYHYDVRFLFDADDNENLTITSESKDLKWIEISSVSDYNKDTSVLRMSEKTLSK